MLAYVSEKLLEAGAWDVYRATVQMKKGRSRRADDRALPARSCSRAAEFLFRETTTIGFRWRLENKAGAGARV